MKILDRYILGEFVRTFLIILGAFALLMLLKEVFGELATLLSYDPPTNAVLMYFSNVLPGQLLEVVPVTVMLAMMFSLGGMAKNKELLAMHAGGVSYVRIALPLGLAIGAITVLVFVSSETFVPNCEARARYAEKVLIKGKGKAVITRSKNITTKGKGNRFYTMKSYDSALKRMERPTIMDRSADGETLVQRIDAGWAQLVTHEAEKSQAGDGAAAARERNYWRFTDAVRYTFDAAGLEKREYFENLEIPMEEDLELFLSTNRPDDEMSIQDLAALAHVQGMRSKGDYYKSLKTDLHRRISFPLGVFILGMIGYTFAVRSTIRALVLEFGMALLCIVVYYLLFIMGEKLGSRGAVSPVVAAWYTNVLFLGFFVYRFHELERVPKY